MTTNTLYIVVSVSILIHIIHNPLTSSIITINTYRGVRLEYSASRSPCVLPFPRPVRTYSSPLLAPLHHSPLPFLLPSLLFILFCPFYFFILLCFSFSLFPFSIFIFHYFSFSRPSQNSLENHT